MFVSTLKIRVLKLIHKTKHLCQQIVEQMCRCKSKRYTLLLNIGEKHLTLYPVLLNIGERYLTLYPEKCYKFKDYYPLPVYS